MTVFGFIQEEDAPVDTFQHDGTVGFGGAAPEWDGSAPPPGEGVQWDPTAAAGASSHEDHLFVEIDF